ncbi:hypothetical protein V2G26_006337 [Clonostachys chloroleuca]
MLKLTGKGLMAIEWSLVGIALILGLARLDLRFNHHQQGFILRDLFYLFALATALTNTAIDTALWHRGIGVFEEDVDLGVVQWQAPRDNIIAAFRTIYISIFTFYLEQYLTKAILITQYFELFGRRSRRTRTVLYLLIGYCAVGFITTLFMLLFVCKLGCFWSMEAECRGQRCQLIKDNVAWAFHFTSDVMIFILPLVCISRLPMSRAQKISAGLTFGLGFINIGITVMRWFIVHSPFAPSTAFAVDEALFITDAHTSLIISILPSLRLYLRIFRRRDGKYRQSRVASALSQANES